MEGSNGSFRARWGAEMPRKPNARPMSDFVNAARDAARRATRKEIQRLVDLETTALEDGNKNGIADIRAELQMARITLLRLTAPPVETLGRRPLTLNDDEELFLSATVLNALRAALRKGTVLKRAMGEAAGDFNRRFPGQAIGEPRVERIWKDLPFVGKALMLARTRAEYVEIVGDRKLGIVGSGQFVADPVGKPRAILRLRDPRKGHR